MAAYVQADQNSDEPSLSSASETHAGSRVIGDLNSRDRSVHIGLGVRSELSASSNNVIAMSVPSFCCMRTSLPRDAVGPIPGLRPGPAKSEVRIRNTTVDKA